MPAIENIQRLAAMCRRLSYKTNRIIGGCAPSEYLSKLEKGNSQTPAIETDRLDTYLKTHLIDPSLLRADKFAAFMESRQQKLLALIEKATGKKAFVGGVQEEGTDVEEQGEAA